MKDIRDNIKKLSQKREGVMVSYECNCINIQSCYQKLIEFKEGLLDIINHGYNLIVIGKTGSGKSILLESLFDKDNIINCGEIYLDNCLNKDKALSTVRKMIDNTKSGKTLILDDLLMLYKYDQISNENLKNIQVFLKKASKFVLTFQDEQSFSRIKPYIDENLCIVNIVNEK